MSEEKEQLKKPRKVRGREASRQRLDEQGIATLDEIFPGFGKWYRESYDEEGNLRPSARVLGLRGEP